MAADVAHPVVVAVCSGLGKVKRTQPVAVVRLHPGA